jgi:hypothetical protein
LRRSISRCWALSWSRILPYSSTRLRRSTLAAPPAPRGSLVLARALHRRLARESLDAACPRGDALLGGDQEQPDVAGLLDVGAAAELDGEAGTSTTRTRSPYLSPKKARAPEASASSRPMTRVRSGVFFRICSFTRFWIGPAPAGRRPGNG